jgi:DNA-binding NarL/FixJ family response regulator
MTVRVVVVDDQIPFLRAARSVLGAMEGFELVGEARSGEDAIVLADELRPDLVLMDVVMSGIGGVAAARAIADAHPGTRTILVSSYREDDLVLRSVAADAPYLHKSDLGETALRRLWDRR